MSLVCFQQSCERGYLCHIGCNNTDITPSEMLNISHSNVNFFFYLQGTNHLWDCWAKPSTAVAQNVCFILINLAPVLHAFVTGMVLKNNWGTCTWFHVKSDVMGVRSQKTCQRSHPAELNCKTGVVGSGRLLDPTSWRELLRCISISYKRQQYSGCQMKCNW